MKKNEIKLNPGQSFEIISGLPVKIMAIVDGYVMGRHKGCFPFVEKVEDFRKRVSKVINSQPAKA